MFKIVHCADLHLTDPSENSSSANNKAAACFAVFSRIIDFTNAQGAALLLIAGDLYDSVFAPEKLVSAVQGELARCRAEIYICGGNHDYCGLHAPLNMPGYSENVHILPPGKITAHAVPGLPVVIYGCSFDAPHTDSSPLAGFEAPDDGRLRIGLLHGDAAHEKSDYAPLSLSQIDRSNLDYLALGHVHAAEDLPTASRTKASYPGIPQPRRFGESGGINLICIDQGVLTLTRHDLSLIHYLTLQADISDCKTDTETARLILQKAEDADTPASCICRVTLTGEPQYQPSSGVLGQLLASSFISLQLQNQTVSLPGTADHFSLEGLFLQEISRQLADCTDPHRKKILTLARRYGLMSFSKEVDTDAD